MLHEYKGALHVHSRLSDGTGSPMAIVAAAQRAGLDFVVLTDHKTVILRRRGKDGWYGSTMLVVGQEITPRVNHLMALGLDGVVKPVRSDPYAHAREVARQGGLGFAVHPWPPRRVKHVPFKRLPAPWRDWTSAPVLGVELWSYMADWVRHVHFLRPIQFLGLLRRPERGIRGPLTATLAEYDAVCQRRRMVAVGGLDAHAVRGPFGLVVFPYEFLFRTIRTHVLADAFTGDFAHDEQALYAALRAGHCTLAHDGIADSTGATFTCSGSGSERITGDELAFQPGLTLRATVPVEASLRLVYNGLTAYETSGTALERPVGEPGVYRIEGRIGGRPWLYTNPIYVRRSAEADAAGAAEPCLT
jgi:hypothetical protein